MPLMKDGKGREHYGANPAELRRRVSGVEADGAGDADERAKGDAHGGHIHRTPDGKIKSVVHRAGGAEEREHGSPQEAADHVAAAMGDGAAEGDDVAGGNETGSMLSGGAGY